MAGEVLHDSSEIVQAIFAGRHDDCARLVNRDSVNQQDRMKRSLLHAAAHCGELRIAELLLRRRAHVDAKDGRWFTPLHRACASNAADVAKLLLARGADRSARDRDWQTPLHVAASNGSLECVQLLLTPSNSPMNVNASDRTGHSALHHAVCGGYLEVARLLLRKGASVNAFDKRDRRAMHWAASSGQTEVVQLLHEFGAEVNCRDADQFSPLHVAAALGYAPVAKYLIELGAELESTTARGNTPLHLACLNGHEEVVELLLAHIANTNARSPRSIVSEPMADQVAESVIQAVWDTNPVVAAVNRGNKVDNFTPVHMAVLCANGSQCLQALLDACISQFETTEGNADSLDPTHAAHNIVKAINTPGSENGNYPIHLAAFHGRFDHAELLLKHGALVNVCDSLGDTPLHIAAERGHELFITCLTRSGCRWDARGQGGTTAFHRAALFGNYECLQRLLYAAVADVLPVDKVGSDCTDHSALYTSLEFSNLSDIANFDEDPAIQERLHEVMQFRDDQGRTIVHDAVLGTNLDCLKLVLLSAGNPFDADYSGRTPLHYAIASCIFTANSSDAVSKAALVSLVLLKLGVEVNACDKYGCTPLHLACAYDTTGTLVRHLIDYGANIFLLTNWPIAPKIETLTSSDAPLETEVEQPRVTHEEFYYSPLHLAINVLNLSAVKLLLDACPTSLLHQYVIEGEIRRGESPSIVKHKCYDQKPISDNLKNDGFKLAPSPILLAAFRGNVSIMRVLLNAWKSSTSSVCPNNTHSIHQHNNPISNQSISLPGEVVDTLGHTALHLASYAGHVDVCRLLLKDASRIGTVLDAKDSVYQWQAFHHAAAQGHYDVVALLLEHTDDDHIQRSTTHSAPLSTGGYNLRHSRDEHGRTALMLAAQNNHPAVLRLLLSNSTSGESKLDDQTVAISHGINFQDVYGRTALHRAVANGHVECVNLLLSYNVDCSIRDFRQRHVLHMAASSGKVETLKVMINHLTRVCQSKDEDPHGQTALDTLCPLDQYGFTPLHFACYRGHQECVRHLLNFACYENLRGNLYTPLHCAVQNGHSACLCLLIGQFGRTNLPTVDSCGRTILHIAAMSNQVECTEIILRAAECHWPLFTQPPRKPSALRSCVINIASFITQCDNSGRTALLVAASTGHDTCTRSLLRMHSKLTDWIREFASPDELSEGSNEVVCILNRLALTFTDSNGQSALHLACSASDGSAVLAILDSIQDTGVLSQRDRSERTPLHLAISSGLVVATEALINRGADLYAVDIEGLIPAFSAASSIQVATCLSLCLAAMFPPLNGSATDGVFIHPSCGRLLRSNSHPGPDTSSNQLSTQSASSLAASVISPAENRGLGDTAPQSSSEADFF